MRFHRHPLRAKAEKHADRLAALMITYPSTHGAALRDFLKRLRRTGGPVQMHTDTLADRPWFIIERQ